jgi:hypothetical protein
VADPSEDLDGMEIEQYLENSIYRDILQSRPVSKEPTKETIKDETFKVPSVDYYEFIAELELKVENKSPDRFICL